MFLDEKKQFCFVFFNVAGGSAISLLSLLGWTFVILVDYKQSRAASQLIFWYSKTAGYRAEPVLLKNIASRPKMDEQL